MFLTEEGNVRSLDIISNARRIIRDQMIQGKYDVSEDGIRVIYLKRQGNEFVQVHSNEPEDNDEKHDITKGIIFMICVSSVLIVAIILVMDRKYRRRMRSKKIEDFSCPSSVTDHIELLDSPTISLPKEIIITKQDLPNLDAQNDRSCSLGKQLSAPQMLVLKHLKNKKLSTIEEGPECDDEQPVKAVYGHEVWPIGTDQPFDEVVLSADITNSLYTNHRERKPNDPIHLMVQNSIAFDYDDYGDSDTISSF